jgi:site-specific recombinase XerD
MEASIELYQNKSLLSREATSDSKVIEMCLHGRPVNTQRSYRQDIEAFLEFAGVGIREVTLADLQSYSDSLNEYANATKARKLSAVKTLLKFSHRLGYTPFDVGAVVRLPKIKNTLAERILSEEQVMRILALESNPRNAILLKLLYASGGRVSEICGLKWKDTQPRDNGQGQVTLYGKGGKTRSVLLSADTWNALRSIRGESSNNDPVFRSRKQQGHLRPVQVLRIVRNAAKRAGIEGNVSPHWFRHCHASHSLDRGCPIQEVADTLGHASLATTSRYTHARPDSSSALYLPV